jgi:hypothetical protein
MSKHSFSAAFKKNSFLISVNQYQLRLLSENWIENSAVYRALSVDDRSQLCRCETSLATPPQSSGEDQSSP